MEQFRMTSRFDRFLLILCTLYFVGLCHAIYDPSVTTVKPPKRREPILPWYLTGKDYPEPTEDTDLSRSPKWHMDVDEPRKPVLINSNTKTWTPWTKPSGGEIEQRTEVTSDHQKPVNTDQNRDWFMEYDQFVQRESDKHPFTHPPSQHVQRQDPYPSPDNTFAGNHGKDQQSQTQLENDDDFYEGLASENTKSHKEKILLSTKPKLTVAQYDRHRGVICPEADSTGQYVYPPDCKFFVNCWKGRAFVQPCAPGTLFNPETLECDFPHKVKCHGGEIAEFPSPHSLDSSGEPLTSESQIRQDSGKLQSLPQAPRCPPHITGMLPHPTDCTKFLQCASGGGHVMNCGPGTVFNPSLSVCDWPRNVRGCEDAYKSTEDTARVPPSPYDKEKSEYNNAREPKKIVCPPDYTGLLSHPETCKKFLQCANGITYVMDCGPGTAFNPLTSVCDWPYNVPSCGGEKTGFNQVSATTIKPWSSTTLTGPASGHYQPSGWQSGYGHVRTTTATTPTDWNSRLRPTWIPSWKPDAWATTTPSYHRGHYEHGSFDPNRPRDYNPVYYNPPIYGQETNTQDNRQNVGNHYPHHHQHHHGYDPDKNSQYPNTYDRQQPPRTGDSLAQETSRDTWHQQHRWNYPTQKPGFQDQTQTSDSQFGYPANRTRTQEGNLPPNRRTGHEFTPNRQEYGRNVPGSHRLGLDRTQAPDGNVYVDSDYDLSEKQEPVAGVWSSATNKTFLIWPSRNRTLSGQSEVPQGGNGFKPSEWNPQPEPGNTRSSPEYQLRPWDQGGTNHDDKLREWETRTNIYQQSTTDSEADRKFDQWASKTNILPHKGSTGHGTKETPPYLGGMSTNGTKGHFITKEIEVHQGHSNTRTFGSNEPPDSRVVNNTFGAFRPRNDTRTNRAFNFSNGPPATNLQPPFYGPYNSSYGPAVNFSGTKPNHWPIYHLPNGSLPPPMPADLLGSGADNRRVWVPSDMFYYPPYYNNYTGRPNTGFPSRQPATNLQPPYHMPPPWEGNYYPNVPASELQPPYYESPNNDSRANTSVPNTNFQPSYYNPNQWFMPLNKTPGFNSDVYYPAPSSELQPPYYQPATPQFGSPNPAFYPKNITNYPLPSTNFLPPYPSVNSTASSPISTLGPQYYPPRNKTEIAQEKPLTPVKKKSPQATKAKPHEPESIFNPNVPTISIEGGDSSKEAEAGNDSIADVVEPGLDVDVLDDTQVWKPTLVFENKTRSTTTTESSVIMRIGKKKTDVDLFNIEAPPFQPEEPAFPSYYIPPVQPLSHSSKTSLPTPISGQVIRLRGGPGPHEGYVEVQGVNPGWGVVCDTRNSWTLKEAHIVCRQLGYIRGAEMAWQGRSTRDGVPTWIAAKSVTCSGNETRFQSCKFTHNSECRVDRDAIGVRCVTNRIAHCRNDEIPHDGQCYHLADPESGLNHGEALEYCKQRQARLIDITNQLENDFISEWLLQKHPEVGSVVTAGVGFTTFNRPIWLWEDSSHAKFRFTKWWPGWKGDRKQPPSITARPACIVMKRKFPCHENPNSMCVADYFFWDAEDCAASTKAHSYICKRPYDDIGCTYGKGSQYTGTANVTASGKPCLPWADPRVAHPLTVNVVNREVRDKLKAHNFCRNPNPNKESQPWCFTGPNGQREHCDIPQCGNIASKRSVHTSFCKTKHFECLPGECIPRPWVCDGEEDCTNGADEKDCKSYLNLFQKTARHKLEGYDVEKWLNTPLKTCALRCKEADFTCRSFAHKASGNICLLSDNNVGITGALKRDKDFDYYEMKERSLHCDGMFVCKNGKCINQSEVCNGKNDCYDRSDENICTVENLDYAIRLAGANTSHEGRIEVKILGHWGQVCDDGFSMINAEVICKELGFSLGALEVRPGGFYGNLDPPTRFMVDQLKCRGNESSLRECDFDGWGVHNCQPEEAVGVVCKTAVDSCQEGHWKCDNSPVCIPTPFICDEVVDCPDGSDESSAHCDAPFEVRLANGSSSLQGRVEVRHHGIWGTVCDDDFSTAAATVICRSLGYGGPAIARKDGHFGPGEGPIWLDEVFCHGNETQLYRCEHNHWGQHNCDHNEDAGVICSPGDVNESESWEAVPHLPEPSVNDLLPANCGKRSKDFNDDEDLIFAKVVHGTVAPKGTYPWQASIRVRGHSRSSHWCGAVMLSPLHVLTAAHCLEGYNKGTYFVRAGDYNTEIDEGTEVEANIEDYYIHEDFRKGHRMNNDIALVLLKGRGIPLGKDIMPICLPHENTEYPAGLNCTISGFGSIETGKSTHSKDLRYGWVPLLDQSLCRADYIYGNGAISDGMVCAGYLDEGVDTCDGDSGGPLACYHNGAFTLYGITSWGQHCGRANKPGVYVRVSYYRRWIDQKIKESLAGR